MGTVWTHGPRRPRGSAKGSVVCAPPRKRRRRLRRQACLRRVKPRRSRTPELQPVPPPPTAPRRLPADEPDRRVLRAVRRPAGRAPPVAGRLRAVARPRAGAGRDGPPPSRRLAHPPGGPGNAHRGRPHGRRRQPARARGRVRPRPPLVARPHGAYEPAAGGAHDARVARLVLDLERRREPAEPDAGPERAVPPERVRLVRPAGARRDAGPGDDRLAQPGTRTRAGARTRTTRAS